MSTMPRGSPQLAMVHCLKLLRMNEHLSFYIHTLNVVIQKIPKKKTTTQVMRRGRRKCCTWRGGMTAHYHKDTLSVTTHK